MKYEKERREILSAALDMLQYSLISLSGGNIALRTDEGSFLITPSAMRYETMLPEDVVLLDAEGRVLEGCRRPSSDTKALLYLFRQRSEINALIHTHQPYATAVGLVEDELPGCLVTVLDACGSCMPVAPFTISSDEGMGVLAAEYAGESLAVILRSHGVITMGRNLSEALEAAIYLEEAARTYLAARALGPVRLLSKEQITECVRQILSGIIECVVDRLVFFIDRKRSRIGRISPAGADITHQRGIIFEALIPHAERCH